MIDFTLADMMGGEPMGEVEMPVFYARTTGKSGKVLEKVAAADLPSARVEVDVLPLTPNGSGRRSMRIALR